MLGPCSKPFYNTAGQWLCTRDEQHEGPCAAVPRVTYAEISGWPRKPEFKQPTAREVALGQAARAAYYKAIDGWEHDHQWGVCPPDERDAWIEAARGVLRSQREEAGIPEET